MLRSLKAAMVFSGALLVGAWLGAASQVSPAYADAAPGVTGPAAQGLSEAAEPAPDPKRRKAGEPCRSSDECQRHHTCAKVGDKNVCQAPPRPRLPPGAVT